MLLSQKYLVWKQNLSQLQAEIFEMTKNASFFGKKSTRGQLVTKMFQKLTPFVINLRKL